MNLSLERIKKISQRYLIFFKWILLSSIVGLIVGSIGTLFHYSISIATHFREDFHWLLFLLPIAGFIIVFIYHFAPTSDDINTNLVIESIRSSKHLPLIMAPLIFISTTLTHLVGGSSGREGAALQLGGS